MGESRELRSRFYDGWLYSKLPERFQAGLYSYVAHKLGLEGRVLDIGCGTGALALRLAPEVKEVVGVDLSPKMVSFARQRSADQGVSNISFEAGDITSVFSDAPAGSFDAATLVMALHEMPAETRGPVLREATRLAKELYCIDFRVPMPWNGAGIRNRIFEVLAGQEHFGAYRDFGRRGGTAALAAAEGLECRHLRSIDAGSLDVHVIKR